DQRRVPGVRRSLAVGLRRGAGAAAHGPARSPWRAACGDARGDVLRHRAQDARAGAGGLGGGAGGLRRVGRGRGREHVVPGAAQRDGPPPQRPQGAEDLSVQQGLGGTRGGDLLDAVQLQLLLARPHAPAGRPGVGIPPAHAGDGSRLDGPRLDSGGMGGLPWRSTLTGHHPYNKLSANIEVALPILAKHVNDERFSYVYVQPSSGVYLTQSVGGACSSIIHEHVEVYHRYTRRPRDDEGRSDSLFFIHAGCGQINKWWKTRKQKTLAELQLEGIEWVLRQKKPDYFKSERDWARAKTALEEMAREIRDFRKPIKVNHKFSADL